MTNKEWLNRGWKLMEEIACLEMARQMAVHQRGKNAAKEYISGIREKERELMKVQLQILRAIFGLKDRKDRQILQLRYLAYLSHEDIALVMGYEETRSVARRIEKAAEKIVCR